MSVRLQMHSSAMKGFTEPKVTTGVTGGFYASQCHRWCLWWGFAQPKVTTGVKDWLYAAQGHTVDVKDRLYYTAQGQTGVEGHVLLHSPR